jgi:hypothetical protein
MVFITVVESVYSAVRTAYIKQITFSLCGPGSSVGIVTELRAGRSGVRIPVGGDLPLLCRPALGPTQPPV